MTNPRDTELTSEVSQTAQAVGLRRPTARTWVDISVLLVLAAVGVIGFEPSFGGYSFLLAGLGGLAVGAATGILASVFRLNFVVTVLAAVVVYFLFGTAIAVPQLAIAGFLPSGASLSALAIGTVYGWNDILTLRTPIGAPDYIAVLPYFVSWLVALVATTLATRWLSVRPRTAWRFGIALIGPVALYLAGVLVGTDEPYQAGIRGVAFAVLALVWLAWRRPTTSSISPEGARRLRNRKLAGVSVVVAASVVVGGGAGFWLAPAEEDRFVLRDEIEPPFDPLDYPSPLSGFRHYTKQVADDVLFSVNGLVEGDVIRLATLDSFTGKLWNVTGQEASAEGSGSFALVGREIPAPEFITPIERSGVTFTMEAYDDVWVPSIGYLRELEFTDGASVDAGDNLRYNNSTGTTVLTSGLREGDTYTLTAESQEVLSPSELEEASVASLELPPVVGSPDLVTSKAQEFAGGSTTPIEQLEAIRLTLANTGFLSRGRASDTPSRAGHGADRITELLERPQMLGDEEQYASAFALMARSFGYPARVVMGFAPEVVEGQAVEVTGADITVWVEVAFDKVGWVAFNPTPEETDIPQDQTPKPQSEPQPQVRQPPRADNDDEDLLSPVELEESEEDESNAFVIPGWVYTIAVSLLIPAVIIFVPMFIVAALKTRRSRRRREALATHDRVAGAWEELTDQYSELGYAVPGKLTRVLVAQQLEAQVTSDSPVRLRSLAATTDEAVFSGLEIDPAESDKVWTEAMAAVELARNGLPKTRQFLSRYRLRTARDWVSSLSKPSPSKGDTR